MYYAFHCCTVACLRCAAGAGSGGSKGCARERACGLQLSCRAGGWSIGLVPRRRMWLLPDYPPRPRFHLSALVRASDRLQQALSRSLLPEGCSVASACRGFSTLSAARLGCAQASSPCPARLLAGAVPSGRGHASRGSRWLPAVARPRNSLEAWARVLGACRVIRGSRVGCRPLRPHRVLHRAEARLPSMRPLASAGAIEGPGSWSDQRKPTADDDGHQAKLAWLGSSEHVAKDT